MAKGLQDFIVRDFNDVNTFDVDKLTKLTLEEFRKKYIEEMQTYFDNSPKPSIKCWECPNQINSANDLIRYYGANLHKGCFKAVYARERKGTKDKKYFDLVLASLDIQPIK